MVHLLASHFPHHQVGALVLLLCSVKAVLTQWLLVVVGACFPVGWSRAHAKFKVFYLVISGLFFIVPRGAFPALALARCGFAFRASSSEAHWGLGSAHVTVRLPAMWSCFICSNTEITVLSSQASRPGVCYHVTMCSSRGACTNPPPSPCTVLPGHHHCHQLLPARLAWSL